MLKKNFLSLSLAVSLLLLTSCNQWTEENAKEAAPSTKLQVIVSFNPIKEFVLAVAKDKVDVQTMIPAGVEPHHFEPKASDLIQLGKAKIFIYNGVGMESGWLDKSLQSVNNKNLVLADASKGFDLIKNTHKEDPHIWLSLKGAENEARNIKDALIKVDPLNENFYEKNYQDFYSQLENLYEEYKSKFSLVANKNFVTGHAAFAYLCRDFGLFQNSVEDIFAEGEPSAKKLKELIDFSKENKIRVIFVEDMVSPKVSNTLAQEVSAKVEPINTLESPDPEKNYLQSMQENLELIYNSLK